MRRDEELSKAPRSEHQSIRKRLKDEQDFKCAELYEMYRQIMDELVTQQNVSSVCAGFICPHSIHSKGKNWSGTVNSDWVCLRSCPFFFGDGRCNKCALCKSET